MSSTLPFFLKIALCARKDAYRHHNRVASSEYIHYQLHPNKDVLNYCTFRYVIDIMYAYHMDIGPFAFFLDIPGFLSRFEKLEDQFWLDHDVSCTLMSMKQPYSVLTVIPLEILK